MTMRKYGWPSTEGQGPANPLWNVEYRILPCQPWQSPLTQLVNRQLSVGARQGPRDTKLRGILLSSALKVVAFHL